MTAPKSIVHASDPEGRVSPRPFPFLTAKWRNLLLLNFEIDAAILRALVPAGIELDTWDGRFFVSVVGFQFLRTRMLGIPVPGHENFEEVNLRFYVRRKRGNVWRRGVVFIKEFVPRRAIAWTARLVYNENYSAVPMGHSIEVQPGREPASAAYSWTVSETKSRMFARSSGRTQPIPEGSMEEFFAEHHWGYVRARRGHTIEYFVDHPRWSISTGMDATLSCDVSRVYGPQFVDALTARPHSAILAEGSEVAVYRGVRVSP